MGIGGFSGVKRQGCEVKHSPPSSAEVKNKWIHTSTTHIRLHVVGREIYIMGIFSVKNMKLRHLSMIEGKVIPVVI
jgi:hypothetical protein